MKLLMGENMLAKAARKTIHLFCQLVNTENGGSSAATASASGSGSPMVEFPLPCDMIELFQSGHLVGTARSNVADYG